MTELEALVVAAYVFALDINRVAVNDVSYRCRGRCLGQHWEATEPSQEGSQDDSSPHPGGET
jgi:hypothetical protein